MQVGVIPIVDVASIYVGKEQGIFEKHGLDLELTLAQGGAAIVPAVQNGQFDFGFSNVTSLVVGRDRGLPMKIVATGPQTTGETDTDFSAVMVAPDSGIDSVKDLEGKRLAVNTLNNIFDVTISEGVEQAGGDPEQVQFVEMAFPDMPAQLEAGNVDAISAVDPFVIAAEDAGNKRIFAPFADAIEDLSVGAYFTTDEMLEKDPELVEKFTAAMKESQEYANENHEAVREALTEYTSISPEVLERIAIPRFPQEHNTASLEEMVSLSEKYGLTSGPVAIDDLVMEGAGD